MADIKKELARLQAKAKEKAAAAAALAAAEAERKRAAAEEKRRREYAARQGRRRASQPAEPEGGENEPAVWIRDNLEWEEYPELWVPKHSTFSDYSGSFVERSNAAYWLEKYPEWFEQKHGGHGTVWVGISEEKRHQFGQMDHEDFDRIKDDVEGLENYPLLDEDGHSEMEIEAKNKAWHEDYRFDVRKELAQHAPNARIALAAVLVPNKEFDKIFYDNEAYPDDNMETEEGGNVYMDVDRFVEKHSEMAYVVLAEEVPEIEGKVVKSVFVAKIKPKFQAALDHVFDPAIADRVARLSDETLYRLFMVVADRYEHDQDDSVWSVDVPSSASGMPDDAADLLDVDDHTMGALIGYFRPEDLQTVLSKDPRQTLLFPESVLAATLAIMLLEGETPKDFLKRKYDNRYPGRYARWHVEAHVPCDLSDYSESARGRVERNFTMRHSASGDVDCDVSANYGGGMLYLDIDMKGMPLAHEGAESAAHEFWEVFSPINLSDDVLRRCEDFVVDSARPTGERFVEAESPKDFLKRHEWVDFTCRTNDPKLAWLERALKDAGIDSRRRGDSMHAPILQVKKSDLNAAWAILDPLDDVPDDDQRFQDYPQLGEAISIAKQAPISTKPLRPAVTPLPNDVKLELKRLGLQSEEVYDFIPAAGRERGDATSATVATGQHFVVGVIDRTGRERLFMKPLRLGEAESAKQFLKRQHGTKYGRPVRIVVGPASIRGKIGYTHDAKPGRYGYHMVTWPGKGYAKMGTIPMRPNQIEFVKEGESPKDFLRRKADDLEGLKLGAQEYRLRAAVTKKAPHAVTVSKGPKGCTLYVTFADGEHRRFGPFPEDTADMFVRGWLLRSVHSSDWHTFDEEDLEPEFTSLFKPYPNVR